MKHKILITIVFMLSSTSWAADPKTSSTKQSSTKASTAAKLVAPHASKPVAASTKGVSAARPIPPKITAKPVTASLTAANRPSTLAEANAKQQVAGQTNIIATVDTPLVTNIVPWQEQEASIPKSPMEFSALKDTLIPTDRDRLTSEIRYTQILNQTSSRQQ
jgi:hypothetical protein